jgi:alkanesulfonate monooxygenase
MRPLEFGWFLPTSGDTTAYADRSKSTPASLDMFDRVVKAAEAAGFEYMLVPVAAVCWDAYIASAIMIGRSKSIRMLVAARPGYVNPVLLAKMIATFDQLSGGRVAVNLIAGQSDPEALAEGIRWTKEQRYELMDEEVEILKTLWTAKGAVDFAGRFHTLHGARISPAPLQQPYPRFYLGGGSQQAWEISAKHADVHLFWGDTCERIAANMRDIRALARQHGRQDTISFGMRLQIVCRETEREAWDAANELVRDVTEAQTRFIKAHFASSVANQRVQELADTHGELIAPHLWTGITRVRPGAGIAVVGNPWQCADTLQQFIDLGCHSFCLSGYLHDAEAERFARLVRPLLMERNEARMRASSGIPTTAQLR